ncbi:MAG: class I SAM-dependent methyltransferase, partial [Gammaproteobacteria bacterium]|nr:class I SAM-dependent methyltransferase [Gammaproteobacteria bacterium]
LELQEFIHSFSKPDICSFKLIDFNKETIDYTRHILNTAAENENKNTKIEFVQRSVHTLLKQANENLEGEETNKYDFVYCAGLFDYLSDRVCARLLNLFYQWTKPGGLVLSTNVHPSNPSRWTMEHVIDWYLIHRDEKQMLDIASKQGEHSVYLDLTGYNVFLETHKPL